MHNKIFSIIALLLVFCNAIAQNRYAEHSLLSKGKWVKISVSAEGVYQLTPTALRSMGFSTPSKVRLYGYNLPVLPEANIEKLPDDLSEIPLYRKSDGTILFYSCGTIRWTLSYSSSIFTFSHFNNPYSTEVCYFVTEEGEGNPKVIQSESTSPRIEVPQTLSTVKAHELYEKDNFSFLNSGRTFYDAQSFLNDTSRTYKITLKDICTDSVVKMNIQFAAAGKQSSTLTTYINNTRQGTMSFTALGEYDHGRQSEREYQYKTTTADQTVRLAFNNGKGKVDGHLDYLRFTYSRRLNVPQAGWLAFNAPSATSSTRWKAANGITAQIGNANANTVVLKISESTSVTEQKGTLNSSTLSVPLSVKDASEMFVVINTAATFPTPTIAGSIANQDLHSLTGKDLVIIVPTDPYLNEQAKRLAAAHLETDGVTSMIVSANEIYNEFSAGAPDATAYRRFVKMLYERAETPQVRPKNLLLFGPCVWDNRLLTSSTNKYDKNKYLLVYESDASLSITTSYMQEEYFALLDDGEGANPLRETPDIGVGRIPVTNASDAKAVVSKLIRYMQNTEEGSWKNTLCYIADDGNSNLHMRDADINITSTQNLYPYFRFKRIFIDAFKREATASGFGYPDAVAAINKQMNEGALVMNYTGHGAAFQLSHEKIIKAEDFTKWKSPRVPLWITAACEVAPIDMNGENLATKALINPNGATMNFIGTARTAYATPNRALNTALMKYLFAKAPDGTRYSTGEALSMAKCEILKSSSLSSTELINKCHFILLGDPSITLPKPELNIMIDSINGKKAFGGDIPSFAAGSKVEVSGHIYITGNSKEPLNTFDGTICPVITDCQDTITCLNNAGDDVSPYVYREYSHVLFNSTDSINNGQFKFSFIVPIDLSYAGSNGKMLLYAYNNERNQSAHGTFERFLYASSDTIPANSGEGPKIGMFINSDRFQSGDDVNPTPYVYIVINDSDGINTSELGLGHNISLCVDGIESQTYNLSPYFSFLQGSSTTGTITYTIPELSEGRHKIYVTAFDIYNNPSTVMVECNVVPGLGPKIFDVNLTGFYNDIAMLAITSDRPETDITISIDLFGTDCKHLFGMTDVVTSEMNGLCNYNWNIGATIGTLKPGIYVMKLRIATADGSESQRNIKFIIPGKPKVSTEN